MQQGNADNKPAKEKDIIRLAMFKGFYSPFYEPGDDGGEGDRDDYEEKPGKKTPATP
jgi:hypothetical protein